MKQEVKARSARTRAYFARLLEGRPFGGVHLRAARVPTASRSAGSAVGPDHRQPLEQPDQARVRELPPTMTICRAR